MFKNLLRPAKLPRHDLTLLAAAFSLWMPLAAAQSCLCGTAADEFVAARVGLEREWVVQIPFDSAAWRLEHVVVGDGLVVAQGGDGTIAAISTASTSGGPRQGSVAWSYHLGPTTAPMEAVGVGPQLVMVTRGRDLVALDSQRGGIRWERTLRTVASASAVGSSGWVYAPLDAGGIVRFPEDPSAQPSAANPTDPVDPQATVAIDPETGPRPGERLDLIEIGSEGEVDFPPIAYRGGILWCTADGHVEAIVRTATASERLEIDLGSPASGSPVVRDGDIFVATRAGDIARITRSPRGLTANSGIMKDPDDDDKDVSFTGWHAIIDEVPEGSPLVGSKAMVVSLGPAGLAAFATANGDLLWQEPAMGQPLAITGEVVWCLEATGFLVARDLATGARQGRLCLGAFTLPVVNTTTERLVLASPGGLVVSLAPRHTLQNKPPTAK